MVVTPIRQCVVSRLRYPKTQLIRLVKVDNLIIIDENHSKKTRGVYLYPDVKLIELAIKKKVLDRAFKCHVDSHIYVRLHQLIQTLNQKGDQL
jgi:predicted RNA-binding protein YlxR (DUF448 family)